MRRFRKSHIVLSVLFLILFTVLHKFGHVDESFDSQAPVISGWETKGFSRQLTSLPNCTPRAIEQFPRGLFTQEQRIHGAIAIHIFLAVYMFGGFALICDDYFVPSLEILCDVFHMQSDVAGATFMAAGSSAPELATAIIAVFIAKDDIGLGTVVGSAVYNVMFVISVCALGAGMVVYLHWWPLFRDCAFYAISVAALAIVIADEKVYWYEALVLVLLYVLYIILMYFNSRLEAWIVPKFKCCKISRAKLKPAEKMVLYEKLRDPTSSNGTMTMLESKDADEWDNFPMSSPDSDYDSADTGDETIVRTQMASTEEPESVFALPDAWWKILLWFVALPLKIILYISVPDCRKKRWKKYFIVTFIMCLVWLTVFSYLMVWMITIIGFTLNVPDTIMALTFVAFGVSLPDVISSLIVVRDGYGDMAISNAVGSNVFDILICLGIPWLLQTIKSKGKAIQVYSEGLLYSTLTLILTVVFLLTATHLNGWRLTKKYGIILMFVYLLFTILSSLYELNVFGFVHPAECVSNY